MEWQKHWGSSSECVHCNQIAVSDIYFCQFCDNVAHRLCVFEMKRKKNEMIGDRVPGYTRTGKENSSNSTEIVSLGKDRFLCGTCDESRKEDQIYYDKCAEKW